MWLLAVVSYLLYTHAVLIYPFARKTTGIFHRNSKLICNFKKKCKKVLSLSFFSEGQCHRKGGARKSDVCT